MCEAKRTGWWGKTDSREIKGATSELSRGVSVHHMKEKEEPDTSDFPGGLCVRKTAAGHLPRRDHPRNC